MRDKHQKTPFWTTLVKFLRRDIRSFFKDFSKAEKDETDETTPIVNVPHLLNQKEIDKIKFRREILDWRDETIIKLGETGKSALYDFSKHTRRLLDQVSIFGRMFPKPANIPLKAVFDSKVRLAIKKEVMRAVNDLTKSLSIQGGDKPEAPSIKDYWPDSPLSCIAKNGFKPVNHSKIISDITPLVNGDKGVVRMFQKQVIDIAGQMIKEVAL